MTTGSPDILVLAVGNVLLSDDAAGPHILEAMPPAPPGVEYLEGGTAGLELLGAIAGRRALIILDAVRLGAPPGHVHVLKPVDLRARRASTAHEGNALELLAVAELTGDLPSEVTIVGIEAASISTGLGLSPEVAAAIPQAVAVAAGILETARNAGPTQHNSPSNL